MEKRIEDFLHLHLGCMIELDNGGSKVRNRKLIAVGGVDDEPYVKLRLGAAGKDQYVHSVLLKENRIKPILRRLESMTEDEHQEWIKIKFNDDFKLKRLYTDADYNSFKWLLSKHFDLFDLIGVLAVDAEEKK